MTTVGLPKPVTDSSSDTASLRLKCKQEDLARGLSIVSGAVLPHSTVPILKNILVSTDRGRLRLSATTLEVNLSADSEPFQIKLQRGKVLRLRIVNQSGEPIPNAVVWLDTFARNPLDAKPEPVQAKFSEKTGTDGRCCASPSTSPTMMSPCRTICRISSRR